MNKQELEAKIVECETQIKKSEDSIQWHDIATSEHKRTIAVLRDEIEHYKQQIAELAVPFSPFAIGVNEPKEGQEVWFEDPIHGIVWTNYTKHSLESGQSEMLLHRLKRGELYPTEQSCIFGSKQREVEAFYRAMGSPFEQDKGNWHAFYDHRKGKVRVSGNDFFQFADVYFRTEPAAKPTTAAVNSRFGAGAFEKYCLGVDNRGGD